MTNSEYELLRQLRRLSRTKQRLINTQRETIRLQRELLAELREQIKLLETLAGVTDKVRIVRKGGE